MMFGHVIFRRSSISLVASLWILSSCGTSMREARLNIDGDRLSPSDSFFDVFLLDRTDPMPPPVGTSGPFDMIVTIDGQEPGLVWKHIGSGPNHSSTASIWNGELSRVSLVLDNVTLRERVKSLKEMQSYLRAEGFSDAVLPNTVSNVPDIDLTPQFASQDVDVLLDAFGRASLFDELFNRPANLSKMGVTAFRLDREGVVFDCTLYGIAPPEAGEATGNTIVRTECSIIGPV